MKNKQSTLERGAGVLMPISSLPGAYGIGTLGKSAYDFADFAEECGFKYWQVLPVGPTSFGDSPYQSFSAFAGNPYFIDIDMLIKEGMLDKDEIKEYNFGKKKTDIDYAALYENRFKILRKAFKRSNHAKTNEYKQFLKDSEYWLEDYALFMALKNKFGGSPWKEWERAIKFHEKEAVERYTEELIEEISFYKFCQFEFKMQWLKLKKYVNDKGIKIIGDIPLYVALDSADVWVHSNYFEFDIERNEVNIAGVPPDMFSATGQRWGNPIYDWKTMEKDDFSWWRERMKANAGFYDVIRIDHFIGIVNYWSIPASCPTAIDGKWKKGPGEKLTNVIAEAVNNAGIIAEDLGVLTEPVKRLIRKTGYPGMKIIEFGLDGPADNEYLPHNYSTNNIVAYTGTHDNETLAGYLKGKDKNELKWIMRYYGVDEEDKLQKAIIRSVFSCIANIVIIQMQDMIGLDNSARTNFPSTVGQNWRWRMKKEDYNVVDTAYYKELCSIYGRIKEEEKAQSKIKGSNKEKVSSVKRNKDIKEIKDVKEVNNVSEAKDEKEVKDLKETKGAGKAKIIKETKGVRETKSTKETKGAEKAKIIKETKGVRETKSTKETKSAGKTKTVKETKNSKDAK